MAPRPRQNRVEKHKADVPLVRLPEFPKPGERFFKVKLASWLIKANKYAKMNSWKTTVGGVLQAVGLSLSQMDGSMQHVGGLLAAAGALLLGWAARDNTVTSEKAGAK